MEQVVNYNLYPDGLGFYADYGHQHIGKISFIRVGIDKLVIENIEVAEEYRSVNVGLNLVRQVCILARKQHRKVMTISPLAQSIFNRHSEFDDVRLINSH